MKTSKIHFVLSGALFLHVSVHASDAPPPHDSSAPPPSCAQATSNQALSPQQVQASLSQVVRQSVPALPRVVQHQSQAAGPAYQSMIESQVLQPQFEDDSGGACNPCYLRQFREGNDRAPFQTRLARAKEEIAPDQGLFREGATLKKRCVDLCSSRIFCSVLPYNSSCNYCETASYSNPPPPEGPYIIYCALMTGLTPVGVACDIATCPVPTSYVCCDAPCTRKWYRSRYESNVLIKWGLRKK